MYAVLRCEDEVSRSYGGFQARGEQFRLARPHQQPAGEGGGAEQPAQLPAPDAFAPDATANPGGGHASGSEGASKSGADGQPPRKRVRRHGQYTPNAREQEAQQRHAAVEPQLRAVLAAFQRSQGSHQAPPEPELAAAAGTAGAQPGAATEPAETGASEEQPTLDLLALAELKAVLKPKLRLPGRAPVDLFDRVIEHSSDQDAVATAHETEVLLPGRCRFLISDFAGFRRLLPGPGEAGYDCVLLDPPWENASARRSRQYATLPSRQLLRLPLPQLLSQAGGLVCVWATNRERHWRCLEQQLLPAWGLRKLATWFWLKVTDAGQLVSPLEVAHRRPYEALLLAAPPGWQPAAAIPSFFAVVAVPGQHSRKPHLGRLLAPFLPRKPRCLELFARELARGWTSAGNEALAFQTLERFEPRSQD